MSGMEEAMDSLLRRLHQLIASGLFEELESDTLEIKPAPSEKGSWNEVARSACAFLNTRGGVVILGIKEEGEGPARKYVFQGWHPHAEPRLRELHKQFCDRKGESLNLAAAFPPPMLKSFMGGQVAIQLVDELPADQKFAFFKGQAYRRRLTGDTRISDAEIGKQEEFKDEARDARELQPVAGPGLEALSLDKLNDYITQLNRPVKIETIKADLVSAMPFLERKSFIRESKVTTLGMLVCGAHPGDHLGFRCQVHGYVDVPHAVAQDKQDLAGNVLPLMESSLAYILRNIQVGISVERGGKDRPQYPEELLRETVNNALAHRDYAINRQVIIAIKPGTHLAIRNPGSFRKHVLVESLEGGMPPVRRIIPEAKPRNPKLADVLRVFRKWEGRGIGMATLVNLCLQDEIDLPYYIFGTEEVTLYLCCGKLLDEHMERLFRAFDGYLSQKLHGDALSQSQKLVLAYLIKSEWANAQFRYTVLLTPDNNHFNELVELEAFGLIEKHPVSTTIYPVYTVDRALVRRGYVPELRDMFGISFDALSRIDKDILGMVYRFNRFSTVTFVSAKEASYSLWYAMNESPGDIRGFDAFYRKVRYAFKRLEKAGFLRKQVGTRGYQLDRDNASGMLGTAPQNEALDKQP